MNLTQHEDITVKVEALERALMNYCYIAEDINLPVLFYDRCGSEAKRIMREACLEIATKDATDQIKGARDSLAALGVEVSESDIRSRLDSIQKQRQDFKAFHSQMQLLASPTDAVN